MKIRLIFAIFLIAIPTLSIFSKELLFRKTNWGMSKENVLKSESLKFNDNGEMLISKKNIELLNLNCQVVYFFKSNLLYKSGYHCPFENGAQQQYLKLKKLLGEKYKKTVDIDEEVWHQGRKNDNIERAIKYKMLQLQSQWKDDDTGISLIAMGHNLSYLILVMYESNTIKTKIEEQSKEEAKSKL